MQRRTVEIQLAVVVLLGMLIVACPFSKSRDSDLHPIGPEVRADLLIYFKTGVSQEEINAFSKDVLSRPNPEGRGDYLPPGVQTFLRIYPAVQGHEGIAITFFRNASDAQRRELKSAIKASPVVYKVLEDKPPSEVKSLE